MAREYGLPESIERMRLPELFDPQHGTLRDMERALANESAPEGLIKAQGTNIAYFPPPSWAVDAFVNATQQWPAATPFRGDPGVIEALSQNLGSTLGLVANPDEIIVTPGTQSALFLAASSLITPGDLVILPDPEYLYSERMLRHAGAQLGRVPLELTDNGLALNRDEFERLCKQGPKLMVFTNPSNPLGRTFPQEELEYIAEMARRYDFLVLADELYCRFVYEGASFFHIASIPGMRERTITVLGPSKTEALTGYRIGVAVAPTELTERMEDLQICIALRAPTYSQSILHHWLVDDREWVKDRLRAFQSLRDMTVARLNESDVIEQPEVNSTAYVFPKFTFAHDNMDLAKRLKREAGVLVNPGRPFGPSGERHIRICYAQDPAAWAPALDRMVSVIEDAAARS